jgi:hypothetical protein
MYPATSSAALLILLPVERRNCRREMSLFAESIAFQAFSAGVLVLILPALDIAKGINPPIYFYFNFNFILLFRHCEQLQSNCVAIHIHLY